METVNHMQVELALENIEGSEFEKFFQAFYAHLVGIEVVPLGGMHDGGADAFLGEKLFQENREKPSIFYQATTQTDLSAKIRQTIKRLREVDREPTMVNFCTSRTVGMIDREEEKLSNELSVGIRIRDRKWIVANINKTPQTVAAFKSYLAPRLNFLNAFGAPRDIKTLPTMSARMMCVFLGQEIDRRRGNTDLLEAVTDSLILWALEETDPATNTFMMRDNILVKIEETLPSAKQFIRSVFDDRLKLLTSKRNPTGREVRWHKKEDKFCLPYETRKIVKDEKTQDEFLKLQIMDLYRQRANEYLDNTDNSLSDTVARVAHRALELTFEKEGLELANFLSGEDAEEQYDSTISDQVDVAIEEAELTGVDVIRSKGAALAVLRQAFYSSTEKERIYYGKLSRTYTLMFTLRNEPKIVEYFKSMSSNFVLFIGSDIIIRALSEHYLASEDQMTINMLQILRNAGSTIILTQVAVREVQAHLNATDHEFRHWFMESEQYVDKEIARHANKILIRSYFYAKFNPSLKNGPRSWTDFIGQICSQSSLSSTEKSRREVADYLIEKFGLEYLDDEDLSRITNYDEVYDLAENLREIKSEQVLALNDAKLILAVYGKRRELGENHRPNPYGYRTWWLTHEIKVRKVTKDLVMKRGAEYIIRPEFILNFIALSPTMKQVRQSYNTIFPTLLGIRLSNRIKDEVFHDVMERVKEVRKVDEARATAMLVQMSNDLKGDNYKKYEANFNSPLKNSHSQ